MANKMLIDAAHPEETRVVVLRGNRVDEFDFESASRKPLRGNIYLAKVTRVEPSLQAAFVDYGGNRHGFLAFSEIHPDYYQIPVADRQALIEAEERANAEAPRTAGRANGRRAKKTATRRLGRRSAKSEQSRRRRAVALRPTSRRASTSEATERRRRPTRSSRDREADGTTTTTRTTTATRSISDEQVEFGRRRGRAWRSCPSAARARVRQYKIQEVIKRRQVLLVQVVKEERGNKGAALTTYLSLAGRYCVLMPNTARGGGISRKITTPPTASA